MESSSENTVVTAHVPKKESSIKYIGRFQFMEFRRLINYSNTKVNTERNMLIYFPLYEIFCQTMKHHCPGLLNNVISLTQQVKKQSQVSIV